MSHELSSRTQKQTWDGVARMRLQRKVFDVAVITDRKDQRVRKIRIPDHSPQKFIQ